MRGVAQMPKKLVRHGNSRAIVIDKAILELLKIDDETELELTTDGRSLRVTPATDAAARAERLEMISDRIMDENSDLFQRLAEAEARQTRLDETIERVEARYSETLHRLGE